MHSTVDNQDDVKSQKLLKDRLELILLLTVVNITQYTIQGISALGTVVHMDGSNGFAI